MNILSLENVSKNFGVKPLFEGATLGVSLDEKIGIIGANGSGKSTLLRVIAGDEQPDTGRVIRAEGKMIAYLPQNPAFVEDATVLETVFAATGGVMKLVRDYESACHALEEQGGTDQRLLNTVAELAHELEAAGGWDLETDARNILSQLDIPDTSALMRTLSGGQRKRVALAYSLITRPDLLILDEPTNHLDADTINWLESWLARFTGALLLVTHDRYFLDRVTTRILEIERGNVRRFDGNYAYYVEKKEEEETRQASEEQKRKMLVKKELAWLRRGAKARTRKSKSRVEAAEALIAEPVRRKEKELDIAVGSRRLGTKVIELHDVSKAYDHRPLLNHFSYLLRRNDRIGIIGPNGAGKTTLLEIITRRIRPDSGSVEVGETVVIGYYDQESRALDESQRVIDYIREVAEQVQTNDGNWITASQMLERFLFPPQTQYGLIGKLSGGERRRLYLLRILMGQPNVLLLDEPTNDLDIPTLIALEEYLDDFGGALIAVSHDRYFLDRTIDLVFRFEGDGEIRQYPGDYSTYLEFREREEAERTELKRVAEPKVAAVSDAPPANTKKKLTFKEQRELEGLERDIASTEARQAEVTTLLERHASDAGLVHELFAEQQELAARLEKDFERWAELAERARD